MHSHDSSFALHAFQPLAGHTAATDPNLEVFLVDALVVAQEASCFLHGQAGLA